MYSTLLIGDTSTLVPVLQTIDPMEREAANAQILAEYKVDILKGTPALYDHNHLLAGVRYLDPRQEQTFTSGCAEPWIAQLVCALLAASSHRVVLETGTFTGTTAAWLCLTLARSGGGEFIGCELDPDRALAAQNRLEALGLPETVKWRILQGDVLETLKSIPDASLGFVWVDDDHTHPHVDAELQALFPKCASGALITGHDVYGSCDLQQEFRKYGGYALDLPRLGPAGGIGLLQVP